MLFILFVSEYLFGEFLFSTLDGQYNGIDLNVIYYLAISLLDAAVCSYAVRQESFRYKVYACVSFALCFFHIYGLYIYWYNLEYQFYEAVLMYALALKLIIAVTPDGTHRDSRLYNAVSSLACRCYAAYLSRFYRQNV